MTPSGSVLTETVEQDGGRTRFESSYIGDQLRQRRTLVPDGSGGWQHTPGREDDFRYWYEPATGNLDCVTYLDGGDVEEDCSVTAAQPAGVTSLAFTTANTEHR